MLSYRQWKLLHESLGPMNLGMGQPQNMGIVGGSGETDEMPRKKKKSFSDDLESEDDMDMDDDSDMDSEDSDMGDEDSDMEDDQIGDEDSDMDSEDSEMGDEEEGDDLSIKKKNPMGEPHNSGPFMKFKMKEGCGDKVEDDEVEVDSEDAGDDEMDDKELKFMQKKGMKKGKGMKKKCSTGMDGKIKKCDKCKDKKVKESVEDDFIANLKKAYKDGPHRFSSGLHEDMLIPAEEPKAGDVGYAPETRIGESIDALVKKIEALEKKLKF